MATPFLHTDSESEGLPVLSSSRRWPGMTISRYERHLLLKSPHMLDTISSSIHGGGMSRLDRAVNIYVDRHYDSNDPARDIHQLLKKWGHPAHQTAGLLTAVRLEHASIVEEEADGAVLLCCTTAGVSNGARAGSTRTVFNAGYTPGTINIMLFIAGKLTPFALVNALQTAVEAKVAALQDLGVRDAENGRSATGTTTDAIVIGTSGLAADGTEARLTHAYAGTATRLGDSIGRLVYQSVTESLCASGYTAERRQ
ncbi:adenosylcobinamide amidohydrolase [Paenibacillus gallinarum]|uniref:Adenosylcobinamide amidohydrolase n=1 Tax=Paenibacillus gallinarum TaxID=2762232 RepID=A0ABR8SSY1_9BACL|nr:adenosylcobinamide amidohydrolase [Paenibacillus gallinarum]MBD7966602.1 adenosylcobinamide amidohydrolase [Paenibacillus gallinarum]